MAKKKTITNKKKATTRKKVSKSEEKVVNLVDAYHEDDPRLRGEKEKKLPKNITRKNYLNFR